MCLLWTTNCDINFNTIALNTSSLSEFLSMTAIAAIDEFPKLPLPDAKFRDYRKTPSQSRTCWVHPELGSVYSSGKPGQWLGMTPYSNNKNFIERASWPTIFKETWSLSSRKSESYLQSFGRGLFQRKSSKVGFEQRTIVLFFLVSHILARERCHVVRASLFQEMKIPSCAWLNASAWSVGHRKPGENMVEKQKKITDVNLMNYRYHISSIARVLQDSTTALEQTPHLPQNKKHEWRQLRWRVSKRADQSQRNSYFELRV